MNYKEIQGDLFRSIRFVNGKVESIFDEVPIYCHCIANDGLYGKGIAPVFIDQVFKSGDIVKSVLAQDPWTGKGKVYACSTKSDDGTKTIYQAHLITKECTFGKPTYETLYQALMSLRAYINQNKDITTIRMPRIGSGIDKLEWDKVKEIIQGVFGDMDINIVVYYL